MNVRRPTQKKNLSAAVFCRKNHTRKYLLKIILLIMFAFVIAVANAEQKVPQITVYKSPTCGCCTKWVKHLEANGFKVEAHNTKEMKSIKQKIGINGKHQSCHTGLIGGYYIEGHVPAQDIKRLLAEKPEAAGLSVPRMPMGSPGMEGHRKDPYSVLLIQKNGDSKVFSSY
ncbi:CopG protein [hydrothermal vent metagenome]|uniref:CopG protein n=1 Tax=hydrothermal vent metagenome TaxID=652676 RepID=A0A3B0ZU79_9ZZZZ